MKFGFLTINNLRPKVLHLFCASIKRLREGVGIDFPAVCVSNPSDAVICSEYNVHHIIQPNVPASEKWNTGLGYLRTLDLDYVVISGSDDIFSTQALGSILSKVDTNPDLIGFDAMYVYCAEGAYKGTLKRLTTKGEFGVGKTVSKKVLDAVDWCAWKYDSPRNFGMDAIFSRNTAFHIKNRVMAEGVIVDVKTSDSLNKFTMFERNHHGVNVDKSIFYNILGEEERRLLSYVEGRIPSLDQWLNTIQKKR